jgi:hypothetical protein
MYRCRWQGVNDSLLIGFDQRVKQVNVSTAADLDALFTWNTRPWSAYHGVWVSTTELLIVFDAFTTLNDDDANVGFLRFTVNPTAGLVSFNGESAPANGTWVVRQGTWGVKPSRVYVMAEAPASARIYIVPPSTLGAPPVKTYLVEWALTGDFSTSISSMRITGTGIPSDPRATVDAQVRRSRCDACCRPRRCCASSPLSSSFGCVARPACASACGCFAVLCEDA